MPQISPEQLVTRLKEGKAPAVVLLCGQDSFLRETYREQIIDSLVDPAARQWAVEHYSAADDELAAILDRARMMPMLAKRQVIIVSDLDEIATAAEAEDSAAPKKSAEQKKLDAAPMLEEYLEAPAPFTVLVLEAVSLDKRTRLAKLLAQKVATLSADLPDDPKDPKVRLDAATRITRQMVSQQNGSIEDDAAEELADLCNGDLAMIRTEITKLLTHGGAGQKICVADVQKLVVSEKKYSAFELADAMAEGNRSRALAFLDKLVRDGEPLPALVGAMAWMFRKLLEARDLPRGTNGWEAAGRLQMRAKQAEIAVRAAQKIPRAQLVRAIEALYEADSRLKSGAKDDRAIMEFLVAEISGAKKAVAGKG